jgi:hypothetical protein
MNQNKFALVPGPGYGGASLCKSIRGETTDLHSAIRWTRA